MSTLDDLDSKCTWAASWAASGSHHEGHQTWKASACCRAAAHPGARTKTGKRIICTDATGAGAGELVYWCQGKESSFPFLPDGSSHRQHHRGDRRWST